MQIIPKLVVRSKEEETAGPKLGKKKPKTIRMRWDCHWDGGGEGRVYL